MRPDAHDSAPSKPGQPAHVRRRQQLVAEDLLCATTAKASVKTVTLSYNGTDASRFEGLNVTSIRDKVYPDERAYPLWGRRGRGKWL